MENLNFKLDDVSSVSKKLRVEIPYETVKSRIESTLSKVAKTANIKGFRPGKAPEAVVRKTYEESIKYDVTEQLINEAYSHIVKEKNLEPVSYPSVSDIKFNDGEPFVFEATFDVKPVFEPNNYKGLSLESFVTEPTEDEVDKIVMSFLESRADMKTVIDNRHAQEADWVDIDFEGYVDGAKKDEMSVKSYVCKIGDKATLIDDLSKGISGMKVGETKDVTTKYPNDYHAEELKGKEVTFKVKLNKLMERILPEFTDELVKELKLSDSKEAFLSSIKDNIRNRKIESMGSYLRKQIIDKLVEGNKFDIPQSEVERRIPEIKERALHSVFGHQNIKGLTDQQKDEFLEKHAKEIRKASEDEVRLTYVIDAIAEKESIKPEVSDIEKELEATAKYMNMAVDKLKEKYGQENLYRAASKGIIENKVYEYIQSQAKITEKKEGAK